MSDEQYEAICVAVTARAMLLIPSIVKREGRYVYGINRTLPENLGWRFVQMHSSRKPVWIESGLCDEEIVETYHEAASAEYFYEYEKDYGSFAEFDCD